MDCGVLVLTYVFQPPSLATLVVERKPRLCQAQASSAVEWQAFKQDVGIFTYRDCAKVTKAEAVCGLVKFLEIKTTFTQLDPTKSKSRFDD